MRNKEALLALLVIGVLLVLASVVVPLISATNTNVIGGAGWPTFAFYFGKTAWLALAGVCVTVGSVVMLVKRKK